MASELEVEMFRSTRDDTLIRTIEARYGIDLHARGDTFDASDSPSEVNADLT